MRGPRPEVTPIAGTTVPLIPTIPWSPKRPAGDLPAVAAEQVACLGRRHRPRTAGRSRRPSVCPYRAGVCTSWSRLAPKVKAAVTASTDNVMPARAPRTGTTARPPPRSRAKRTPRVAVTGAPGAGQPCAQPRPCAARPCTLLADGRAGRREPPGRPGGTHNQQHDDGNGAGRQHGRVDADARVRLGQPRRPDRHQRRSGHRHRHGGQPPRRPRPSPTLDQASRPSAGLRVDPQRRQRGVCPPRPAASWRTAACPVTSSVVTASTSANSASETASGRTACPRWQPGCPRRPR